MASESLNDINPWPVNALNKIQKAKVKKIIQENIEEPNRALQKVKEYLSTVKKVTIRGAYFDKEVNPTCIEIATSGTIYIFEFEKLRRAHGIQQEDSTESRGI
jgi:hypothetical protein